MTDQKYVEFYKIFGLTGSAVLTIIDNTKYSLYSEVISGSGGWGLWQDWDIYWFEFNIVCYF